MVNVSSVSHVGLNPYYFEVQNNKKAVNPYFGDRYVIEDVEPQEKIGIAEGTGLLFKGVGKQVKDMVTSIFEHPIRTLAVVGGTTAALFALPLVGIPVAVGGAAMTIGFAGFAVGKGAKHAIEFAKNNSIGEYDKARENLEQIGGDTVDLALAAPFVPKALKEVNRFSKYGKIAYNTEMVSNLSKAKGFKAKFNVLKGANKEASRAVNFNEATEIELAKLNGITDAEKIRIKEYIKKYNVPKDKIPEVTLDLWAQERGISTKPGFRYQSLKNKNTMGYASPNECRITLNDFGDKNIVDVKGNVDTDRFSQLGTARIRNNKLEFTYKDNLTGETFTETIDRSLVQDRNNLINGYKKCSKEAQQILTTTHEREHIDQFARGFKIGELGSVTDEARNLYTQMAREIPPMSQDEVLQTMSMMRYNPVKRTLTSYIAEPMEIGARAKEAELLNSQSFQTLDSVFKQSNTMKTNLNTNDIALNAIRAQSAAA